MTDRARVEAVAAEIVAAITREFPRASVELDFETERDDYEDAYLWVSAGGEDPEEVSDMWGLLMRLVRDAYREKNVYLVARMKGGGVIIRERPDRE